MSRQAFVRITCSRCLVTVEEKHDAMLPIPKGWACVDLGGEARDQGQVYDLCASCIPIVRRVAVGGAAERHDDDDDRAQAERST